MAKLTGPLMSMGARGQIGKAFVVSNWKGIKYARQHVIPANPRTTAQQNNRTRFALLREMYKLAPAIVRAPWTAFVTGRPFTEANKFVGENNRLLNGQADMLNAIMSPGARGGLPPSAVSGASGSSEGEVDVTVTPPAAIPDGWTVTAVHAAAVTDQDPVGIFSGPFVAGSESVPANPITLAGFGSGAQVVVYGWVEYEKPDGLAAYSVSVADAVTAGT